MSLQAKPIVLGVTGGIAAYKSAELVRLLIKAGAQVKVVMTQAAQAFITPLTLQALSTHPVHHSLLDEAAERGMGHIELARWADLILIAPASADCIARLAGGRADDLLTTLCLATQAPIALAPSMNQAMWRNAMTQHNIQRLRKLSPGRLHWFGPDSGDQACGDEGLGRMQSPQQLVQASEGLFAQGLLAGVRVMVTAGPTQEPLDPVRYLGNRSSGKMGFALAGAAAEAGAQTHLISGPVHLPTPDRVQRIDVDTAQRMYTACHDRLGECDIFIGAAAVADYRPQHCAVDKLKKTPDCASLTLTLVQNPDIIASVAQQRQHRPYVVGFAAETCNLVSQAQHKWQHKGLDLLFANDVSQTDYGFDSELNQLTLIDAQGVHPMAAASKTLLARQIIQLIAQRYPAYRKHRLTSST